MKRALSALLIFVAIFGLTAAAVASPVFLDMGTGSVGGTYYPVGSAMVVIWNRVIPDIRASVQSTGGTAHNLALMLNGDVEIATMDGLHYLAFHGMGPFEGNPHTHLRGLVPMYPEPIHLVVAEGSGITSIRDLPGRNVVIGAVASGTEFTVRTLLNDVLGICPDNDIRAQNLSMAETASAFADRQIDAAFMLGALGTSSIMEVTTMGTGHIIPIEDDIVEALHEALPYFTPYTIPANSYPGQTEEIRTAAAPNIVAIHKDVPEDLVYYMTRALFDHRDEIISVAVAMEYMTVERVNIIEIPLHPGAERFYRSVGALQ